MKDKYLRLAAEYDNFKKRSVKERTDLWQRAQADLIQRLVEALDDLARFAHVDPAQTDAKTIHDGVDMVERRMRKALEAAGVARGDQAGVPFDPHVHEADTARADGQVRRGPEGADTDEIGAGSRRRPEPYDPEPNPHAPGGTVWRGGETPSCARRKAFRRLAKQYHPDRNPNNPQAADRFKEINEAHDVLSAADKRKKYDQLRRYGAFAGAGQGYGRGGGTTPGPDADFDLSDLSSFGGLGDLFS